MKLDDLVKQRGEWLKGEGPNADIVLVNHQNGNDEFVLVVFFFGETGEPVIFQVLGIVVDGSGFSADVEPG